MLEKEQGGEWAWSTPGRGDSELQPWLEKTEDVEKRGWVWTYFGSKVNKAWLRIRHTGKERVLNG